MANIPEVYLLQATKKNLELAKSCQNQMAGHFFEHTMFDVKDALTSILALCDMEDMKQLPQVKKYIQRVTDLLNDVRLYHDNALFNINHVLINVINVLKKRFKTKIHISHDLSYIKAHTISDRNHLELVLLFTLIEAVESTEGELNMKIQLMQKERDALININLEDFEFSSVALKEILDFHDSESFKMQITSQKQGTEIMIRLPLSFEAKESEPFPKREPSKITVGTPKKTEAKVTQ